MLLRDNSLARPSDGESSKGRHRAPKQAGPVHTGHSGRPWLEFRRRLRFWPREKPK